MEFYSEIYGNYYKAVAKVIDAAQDTPLSVDEMRALITKYAFADSPLYITPKLTDGSWPLLEETDSGYVSTLSPPEEMPLTTIQKRWIVSILSDPRIGLFLKDDDLKALNNQFAGIPPLYSKDDFYIYDSAEDGDSYSDPEYRRNFKIILDAVNNKRKIYIRYSGKKGRAVGGNFLPHKIEYSAKDDKFRALCTGGGKRGLKEYVFNVSRIDTVKYISQEQCDITPRIHKASDEHAESLVKNRIEADNGKSDRARKPKIHAVKFEITEERNALERVLVQFANYAKTTTYDMEDNRYICTLKYNSMDETEVLIMLLSFGPTIRIIGPEKFLKLFKDRIIKQNNFLRKEKL